MKPKQLTSAAKPQHTTPPPTCTCDSAGKRGPSHKHSCPVFLAWSHRPTPTDNP